MNTCCDGGNNYSANYLYHVSCLRLHNGLRLRKKTGHIPCAMLACDIMREFVLA